MNLRPLVLMIAAAILAAGLVGCGGGGGGEGDLDLPGVSLTISADAEWSETRSVTSRAPTINASLDDGAVVVAYNYMTGAELDRGVLTAGQCTLDVTPGLTVLVVITGTRTVDTVVKNYRLSTIIANVPVEDEDVVADPATTIAAEAVATKHPVGTTVLDDAIFSAVLTQATAYVQAHVGDDYSLTGGLIGGTAFGGVGSIVVATVQAVVDAVPNVIDSNLVLAKNAVQQIKEAGVPLLAMTEQEIPDAEGIFTDEVIAKYEALASRLSKESLLGGVMRNGVRLGGEHLYPRDIPLGHTYTLDGDSGTLTVADTGGETPDKYTIKYTHTTDAGDHLCTLVAVKSSAQWTLTETRDTDTLLEYKVSFPDIVDGDPGDDPSLTGNFSFKDADFPTALTFNGTASAEGADKDAYTKMVFNGTLTSPNLSARGRFEVNFRSTMPSNPKPDAVIYDFATSASMTDADISATDSAGNTITLTGDMSATATTITQDEFAQQVPTHFQMTGGYSNSKSGMGFEGSITANWTNPGVVTELTAKGNVNLHGELTRTGYPTYYEDVTVTLDNGAITSQIDLRVGGNTLQGSASGTMVHDNPPYGTLTLTNQAGVQFNLALSASEVFSGSVKAGDPLTQVATITKSGDRMRITFDEDPVTYEEF